jgi:hypothetical protein
MAKGLDLAAAELITAISLWPILSRCGAAKNITSSLVLGFVDLASCAVPVVPHHRRSPHSGPLDFLVFHGPRTSTR